MLKVKKNKIKLKISVFILSYPDNNDPDFNNGSGYWWPSCLDLGTLINVDAPGCDTSVVRGPTGHK